MLKRVSKYLRCFFYEAVCCVVSDFIFLIMSLRNLTNICVSYFRLFTILDDQLGEIKNQSFRLLYCIRVMETGVSGNYFVCCIRGFENLILLI